MLVETHSYVFLPVLGRFSAVITEIWLFGPILGAKKGDFGSWLHAILISLHVYRTKMLRLLVETHSYMVLTNFRIIVHIYMYF